MESWYCTKSNSCLDDYISSYESWLNLLKDTKKEIKKILIAFLNKWNWIGNLTQDELLKMYSLMDSWDNIYWHWVAVQLMENWLLDSVYVQFLSRFIIFENNFCISNEAKQIKNNPKLLDKYTKTVRIKISQILNI